MLRSSTLFGAEAYYTLSEKELLLLEKIDLECIAKILDVRPIHLIYLECGLLPARFQMQKMKLHYLKYLLEQRSDSLLFKFFKQQLNNSSKGDWIFSIRNILKENNFHHTFTEIKNMTSSKFTQIVNEKVQAAALKYLMLKVKSKGKGINYKNSLSCQKYLQPNKILSFQEQKDTFKYRTRMNLIKNNFRNENLLEKCLCMKILTNEHLYTCDILNNNEKYSINYTQILNGSLGEQKFIINTLNRNMKLIEKFTLA